MLTIRKYVRNVIIVIYVVENVWLRKANMIINVTYAKAMFKYVLFYYQPKDKKSENLEKYVQYLEKIKKTTKRDGKSI